MGREKWLGRSVGALVCLTCQCTAACVTLVSEAHVNKVMMNTSAIVNSDNLSIHYEVTNREAVPIFLFNVFLQYDEKQGDRVPIVDVALRDIVGDTLHVRKGPPTPLPGQPMRLPVTVHATKVEPGKTFSETVSIKTPVKAWSPYAREQQSYALGTVHGLDFTLDYVLESASLKVFEDKAGEHTVLTVFPEKGARHSLRSELIKVEIPVAR